VSLNLDKSGWKRVAFGDVVSNVNITVRDPESVGIDRVIAMEHMDPGELKVQRWGSIEDGTTFTRRVTPGQTLFGKRRAYQRKVAFAEFDAICSGDILTFEADETHMLPRFLPFLAQSNEFFDHALGTSAGSLSPRTNWRDLSKYEFDLPPLDEQKRIADLLWAVDHHLYSLRTAKASFQSDEASEGVGRLLFSEQSKVWPTIRFGDAVTVGSGTFLPAKNMTPGVIPVYGGNGVSGHHDKAIFDQPVVMIGRVGAYCGAIHRTTGASWVTDNALVVKDAVGYEDEFLASALRHSRLNQFASQTAQPAVSAGGLASVELPRPKIEAQLAYLANRGLIAAAADSIDAEFSQLATLRTSLFAGFFGGN